MVYASHFQNKSSCQNINMLLEIRGLGSIVSSTLHLTGSNSEPGAFAAHPCEGVWKLFCQFQMATFSPSQLPHVFALSLSLARRGLEPPVPYKVTMSVRHSLCLCSLVSNYAAFRDTWEDNKVLCLLHLSVWRSPILSQGLLLSVVVWGTESFLPISTVSSSHPPSQFCPWWTRLSFCLSQSEFVSFLLTLTRLSINA